MSRLLLNIITPCTQTNSLELLHSSMVSAKKDLPIDIHWYVVFDALSDVSTDSLISSDEITIITNTIGNADSISGSAQINYALDQIGDGYIHILKEDNLLHPDILKIICESGTFGLLVEQYLEDDEIRPVVPLPGLVDCAQFIAHHSLVGGLRFHLGIDNADGIFIQKIYNKNQDRVRIINEPLSYLKKVGEYRLIERAPETFGVGSLVTINSDYLRNKFSKITTFMLRGTIMRLNRQEKRKMIISSIIEEPDVFLVTILPPRKSNIAWRQGKGTVLKFENKEQALQMFDLVKQNKLNN